MYNRRGADLLLTGWLLDGGVGALGVLLWADWASNMCWQWLEASIWPQWGLLCMLNLGNDDFWS